MKTGSSPPRLRPGRKAFMAAVLCLGLFSFVEVTGRLLAGPPPLPAHVARAQSLEIVEQGGEWVARRGVDARIRRFQPADGRPRVAVLGGSSVMQDPLEGPQNFPLWLDRTLPEVQVLNLGTPGASSTGLAVLAGQLQGLALDAVVVYSGHNDFGNLLMGGELDTSAGLHLKALQLLSGSWVHHGLRRLVVPPGNSAHLDTRRDQLLFTQDDSALSGQGRAIELMVSNFKVLAQGAALPVLWVPPISNPHHAPQGMLAVERACTEVASGVPRRRPERPELLAQSLAQACGEGSALDHWLLSQAALNRRKQAQAVEHFHASLALDPTPLRAPQEARLAQFELAESLGQPTVDLWATDPLWQATDFVDTLHFSTSGAEKVARAVAPELERLLSPPGEPQAPRR